MNLSQLEILGLLQENNYRISKVAEKMNIVQSAVSRQLMLLENEIGAPLFERHGKILVGPTLLGLRILDEVSFLNQSKRNIVAIASDYLDDSKGTLRLATTHTQAKYFLPLPLKEFRKKYPNVQIYIEQSSPNNLLNLVHQHKVDIAICTEQMESNKNLVIKPCYQWHHIAVVPIDHPLSNEKNINLEKLVNYPILTYSQGFTGRRKIESAFKERNIPLDVTLSAADSDIIKAYVRLGFGVGIITEAAYEKNDDNDLVALSLDKLIPPSTTKFAYLQKSYLPSYFIYFIELLQNNKIKNI